MSIELTTVVLFGGFILLLAAGLPLVFALGSTAIIGTYFLWGPQALAMVGLRTFSAANSFVLIAVPLFIFMGCMLERSGIARDLYDMLYRWLGGRRGGLAAGTVIGCGIFAAMVGVSGASTVTMAVVALPSMLERGYDKRLAVGCIAAGGALGVLIPPSVVMIVLGLYANVSIGALFLGGIPAGALLMLLFIAYIAVACRIDPSLGPAVPPDQRAGWADRLASLKAVILPVVLIMLVIGSILSGAATPTEAAGVGAAGAMLCAAAYGKLTPAAVAESARLTLRLSCMVIWIVFAASIFTALYTAVGAQGLVREALGALPGGRWGAMIGMQLIWMVMGCFLDPIGIMIITAPLFFPLARSLGFDLVWFGVLFVVNMEMAYLTPPFGFNLFYIRGVAPPSVRMVDIYRGVIPFVALQLLGLVIMMIFPEIILFLPRAALG
ncbi:TRAP transporter large permease subunit [Elioraea sp. Yellowstone]|uniref:TRAP transporter large permease n=1 Tax=Elioraea sp. Yellowstone TaxID=2592070 RepID=UPI0011509473|nr:TRAP transporter large permease subunit [Elioraea sp. Yellowstone]TQF79871.1 TRAP transporter large permease subunit [Elioraea sp. Yellowstone]